jgi:hypothetical protein
MTYIALAFVQPACRLDPPKSHLTRASALRMCAHMHVIALEFAGSMRASAVAVLRLFSLWQTPLSSLERW